MENISQNLLETLRKYDTPTIVNSLEHLDTKDLIPPEWVVI